MHLIFIQIEKAQTQLLCNYNWQFSASLPAAPPSFHKLQAWDSKLQYSHNLVGFTTVINLQGCITECYDKYDIKGMSAQHYLLPHSNSVSDYMFRPTKWSSSGLSS